MDISLTFLNSIVCYVFIKDHSMTTFLTSKLILMNFNSTSCAVFIYLENANQVYKEK